MRHGIKRWWQRLRSGLHDGPRLAEAAAQIRQALNLPSAPALARRGGDGADSIYLVSHAGKTLGVLRLAEPGAQARPLPADRPYMALPAEQRIAYEWEMYAKGAAHGLTPKPLWRAADALLCEYLPARKLHAALEENPSSAWEILCRAARAVQRLHAAGLTHMDVSLHNMLEDGEGRIYFIDFEYAPAPRVLPPAQRVYDHLRLVESAWKFIPEDKKAGFGSWLEYFSGCMDEDMRKADLKLLEPSLTRLLAAPGLGPRIRSLFG